MSVIRTFRAASVRQALALVRAELGDEALILGQREVRQRWLPWRKAQVEMELTAAIAKGRYAVAVPATHDRAASLKATDENPKGRPAGNHSHVVQPIETRTQIFDGESRPSRSSRKSLQSPATQSEFRAHEESFRVLNRQGESASAVPQDPFQLFARLIEQDLDEDIARILVGELQKQSPSMDSRSTSLPTSCRELIASSVPCSGGIRITPGRQQIVALVGPTGVGKTTTVAKLAANFRLRDRLRVGLITVDTFRVAAVEQLRTYAELIDVPMHVVTTPREMPTALDDLAEMDLVLIDTAGRSPSDDLRIQELRSFLQAAHADEVHLVASLTAGLRNFALTVERFRRVGPTSLLLTKLDEAPGPGAVVSAAWEAELPLSYITTGQDVPDDIETAESDVIAHRVLPADRETVANEREPADSAVARRQRRRVA